MEWSFESSIRVWWSDDEMEDIISTGKQDGEEVSEMLECALENSTKGQGVKGIGSWWWKRRRRMKYRCRNAIIIMRWYICHRPPLPLPSPIFPSFSSLSPLHTRPYNGQLKRSEMMWRMDDTAKIFWIGPWPMTTTSEDRVSSNLLMMHT